MLDYIENDVYFLSMNMTSSGDCEIRLCKKVDELHGERVYTHLCSERTEVNDFDLFRTLKKRILNNTITEDFIKTLA